MKKCVFLLLVGMLPQVAHAALKTTTCNYEQIYTSCNAGYYLYSNNCRACATGTYKNTSGAASSCTTCLSLGGVVGATVATASKAATSCYIPANTSISDTTGTYVFTSNCFYSN